MSNLPILRDAADSVTIFDPATGEELEVATAATDRIAAVRSHIRDIEEDLRLAKQLLDAEVLRRMDNNAQWTIHEGGYTLKSTSPEPTTEYRADELSSKLADLVDDGVITREALENAVQVVVTYKAKPAGIKALLKLGGQVAEAVAECSQSIEKQRRVSVSRA